MWLDDFLALMSGSTINRDDIDGAYALKDAHLPQKLYKFREVNDNALQNLMSDTVWLCSADKYNDPYECATTWCVTDLLREAGKKDLEMIIELTGLEKQMSLVDLERVRAAHDPIREIARALLAKEDKISEEQQQKLLEVSMQSVEHISKEGISQANEFSQRGMKICSFSARVDSIVMWGHYAKSHTGFVVEYDISTWARDDIRRRILHPVVYRQELFDATEYHLQALAGQGFNYLFGTIAAIHKSPDWSYEDEWRFVLPMGESFADQNYPMPKPSGLYLGSRIKREDMKRLADISAEKGIPVYKMGMSATEYKLVAHQLSA